MGRLVASRWTGEKTEEASNTQKKNHGEHEEIPKNSYDEEYNGYDSEDNEGRYDDDDADADADDEDVEDHIEDLGVEVNDDSSSSYKYNSDDEPDISGLSICETNLILSNSAILHTQLELHD